MKARRQAKLSASERARNAEGKPSPLPVPTEGAVPDLLQVESSQCHRFHAPGQRFRGLAQACGRGAAKHGEQIRTSLDLVDHHRPAKRRQRNHGRIEAREVTGILQVEVGRTGRGHNLPRKGRLPGLARAGEDGDPASPQRSAHLGKPSFPVDHVISAP
jgi:hypothetical protein